MNSVIIALIAAVEIQHGIPSGLLKALCMVESGGDASSIHYYDGNGTHSVGLCQVKESTARMFIPTITEKQLLNPKTNAKIAGMYLKKHYKKYKSWSKALIAYNKGHANGYFNSYNRKVFAEWAKK